MALKPGREHRRVTLLGYTTPRAYEAGTFGGTAFPAGMSMRVCIGHDEYGFDVLKVKGRDFSNVWPTIEQCARGVEIDIEFTPGTNGDPTLLHAAGLPVAAGKS